MSTAPEQKGNYSQVFHSLDDYISHCEAGISNWTRGKSSDTGTFSFTKTQNIQEAFALAREGWGEGLKKLVETLATESGKGRTRERLPDVAGDLPDVGRFLAGEPVCMSRRIPNEGRRRPIIDIAVCCSFHAGIRGEAIMYYGAAIVEVIDALENAGFSVSLSAYNVVTSRDDTLSASVRLKSAGEAMDMGRIIFAVAHPSYLRRLFFRFIERHGEQGKFMSGYGTPVTTPPAEVLQTSEDLIFKHDGLYTFNSDCRDLASAKKFVLSLLKKQRPELVSPTFEELYLKTAQEPQPA